MSSLIKGMTAVTSVCVNCVCQVTEAEPSVMWLSGLHIPESYLTALVQATCRKNGWPLDKSTLYTNVTQYVAAEDVTERTSQGQSFVTYEVESFCRVVRVL